MNNSIDVSPEDNHTSEPEPDIVVLRRSSENIDGNPVPSDIAIIIEVADTSLDFDPGPKAQLYSRAGIPEHWVMDVIGRRIHQFREPKPSGYAWRRLVEPGDQLAPLAKPEALLDPNQVL